MEPKLALSQSMPGTDAFTSRRRSWSISAGKRIFDLSIAIPLTVIALPVMVVTAFLVKCSSRGPILFRQDRVGRGGVTFQVLKFRTMVHGKHNVGPGVTQQGDARIFPVGRRLRKWKLDELPQLINVLRGDMSLVGPRPDLPGYIATLTAAQREILCLRPGITGSATLRFRHEEDLLAGVSHDQLQQFYVSRILPEKIEIDLAYAQQATLLSDIKILFRTLAAI